MSSDDEDVTKPPQPNQYTHFHPPFHQHAHHYLPPPLSGPSASGYATFPGFQGMPYGMPYGMPQNHQPRHQIPSNRCSSDNTAVSPHDTHDSNVIYEQSPYLSEAPSLVAGSGSTGKCRSVVFLQTGTVAHYPTIF